MMKKLTKEEKLAEYITKHKTKCKYCGAKIFIIPTFKKNKILCGRCGRFIYKDPLDEFRDKLKIQMRKEEQNEQKKTTY